MGNARTVEGKWGRTFRWLLPFLHGAFAAAAIVLLGTKDHAVFLPAWAPGLVALAAIVFTLNLPGSRNAVIIGATVSILCFGPGTLLCDSVARAGLFEGRSLVTPWLLAGCVALLALEAWTIRYALQGDANRS